MTLVSPVLVNAVEFNQLVNSVWTYTKKGSRLFRDAAKVKRQRNTENYCTI